jgi:SnoaL-like polyketide cyclase
MPETSTRSDIDIAHDLVSRDFRLMENWDDAEAAAILAPTMYNAESTAEPPAARQPGVAGARATYDWLHSAYADLRWTIHNVVAEGDWVAARTTMSGRQIGPFASFAPDGDVAQVFPPTGRSFAVGSSWNTTPIATTWARHSSSAGSLPHPARASRVHHPHQPWSPGLTRLLLYCCRTAV